MSRDETYNPHKDMSDDVNDSLKFLREREIVHSLRFREAVEIIKDDRNTLIQILYNKTIKLNF